MRANCSLPRCKIAAWKTDHDLAKLLLSDNEIKAKFDEIAGHWVFKHRINLKPVMLLKAQRTIAQSQENKANFHKLIDGLTAKQIASPQVGHPDCSTRLSIL